MDHTAATQEGHLAFPMATKSRGYAMSAKRYLRPIKETARFSDLERWDELFGYCFKCGRIGAIDRDALQRRYGKHLVVHSLKKKLRCIVCGSREMNMIGASNKLRD